MLLLLPATCLLFPLLLAGAFGSLVALLAIAIEPSTPFRHRLFAMVLPATIICWVTAATLGMFAAWLVVFEQTLESFGYSRVRRYAYLVGLLFGEVAGVTWLFVMSTQQGKNETVSWVVWLVLLVGPLLVGVRHSVRIIRQPGRTQQNVEPADKQPT